MSLTQIGRLAPAWATANHERRSADIAIVAPLSGVVATNNDRRSHGEHATY